MTIVDFQVTILVMLLLRILRKLFLEEYNYIKDHMGNQSDYFKITL